MSFFGMGPSMMGAMPIDAEKIRLAENELAMLQSLHKSIVEGCKQKCFVNYYTEVELSKGESCCVTRCTSKFFQANILIGEHLRDLHVEPRNLTSPSLVLPTLGQHSTLEGA